MKQARKAYYKRVVGELEPLGVDFNVSDRDGRTPKQVFDAMSDEKYRELYSRDGEEDPVLGYSFLSGGY